MSDQRPSRIARLQPGAIAVDGARTFVSGRNGEWRSRGYLPHFDAANAIQHVTFRLADSLPEEALERLEWELDLMEKEAESGQAATRQAGAWRSQERRKRLQDLMDSGLGSCLLREPEFAKVMVDALKHFDGVRYRLVAWVVMPNHVHVLFETIAPWTMAKVVWSWKAWTGRRIAKGLKGERAKPELADPKLGGPIWFREYWDRFVRNERHLQNVVDYIHQNPVKAGLVTKPEEWRWSSAWVDSSSSV